MALGAPALIVPLPGALDQDQANNARTLVTHGGAWMMDQARFKAETLAEKLQNILSDASVLSDMSAKALGFATPDAADNLARVTIAAIAASPLLEEERV